MYKRGDKMKRLKCFFAVALICISTTTYTYAATSGTVEGKTSGGSYGIRVNVLGICDGDDHVWPWGDDAHITTQADKDLKVIAYGNITTKKGKVYSVSPKSSFGRVKNTVNIPLSDGQASKANSVHQVQSADYGNFTGYSSCTYN